MGWLLALAAPAGSAAQVSSAPAPPSQLPSRAQIEQPAPPVEKAVGRRVTGRTLPPVAACPLTGSTLKVTITSIRFQAAGRTALPAPIAAALAPVRPIAGGEQPVASICAIRDAANAALAKAGYIASVQIPPQQIIGGVLTLDVVLARIVEVRVHGEAGRYRPVLAKAIARLRALDPLNERQAERILLLVGDVPGLTAQLALRPAGTAPGDVIGDLTVTTRRLSFLGNVQDYGSRALGRWTGYLRGDVNSILLPGDTFYVGGSTTAQLDEQQVAQVGYRAILNGNGLSMGPRYTYAWSQPDIGDLDLRSRSSIAGFDVTQPIVRSVRRNLSATVGYEMIEQKIRIYNEGTGFPLNLDKLREVFVRFDGRLSAPRRDGLDDFSLNAAIELRKGLDIFHPTRRGEVDRRGYTPSRFEGDPEAFVVRANVVGQKRLGRVFSIAGNVLAQWANHPLLNFDEQAIGNLTSGLGYDPGSNSGDRFVGVHGEGRIDFNLFQRVGTQLFVFGDNVWLWNLDTFSTEANRHFQSVGGGARFRLPGPMLLELTYAKPLDRVLTLDTRRSPQRFLASLTFQFRPGWLS